MAEPEDIPVISVGEYATADRFWEVRYRNAMVLGTREGCVWWNCRLLGGLRPEVVQVSSASNRKRSKLRFQTDIPVYVVLENKSGREITLDNPVDFSKPSFPGVKQPNFPTISGGEGRHVDYVSDWAS